MTDRTINTSEPSADQLRHIAFETRQQSFSSSDDAAPVQYVLAGWRAALASRHEAPAATTPCTKCDSPDACQQRGCAAVEAGREAPAAADSAVDDRISAAWDADKKKMQHDPRTPREAFWAGAIFAFSSRTAAAGAAQAANEDEMRYAFQQYDWDVRGAKYQTPWQLWRDGASWAIRHALAATPAPEVRKEADATLNGIVDRKYPANPQRSVTQDWQAAIGCDGCAAAIRASGGKGAA